MSELKSGDGAWLIWGKIGKILGKCKRLEMAPWIILNFQCITSELPNRMFVKLFWQTGMSVETKYFLFRHKSSNKATINILTECSLLWSTSAG